MTQRNGNVPLKELPAVISRMERRLAAEAGPAEINEAWTATFVLLGLRYSPEVGRSLLSGVREMKESSTYQAILAEGEAMGRTTGRLTEARALLVRLGTRKLGSPQPQYVREVESIADLSRLESLIERTIDASSWDELLHNST